MLTPAILLGVAVLPARAGDAELHTRIFAHWGASLTTGEEGASAFEIDRAYLTAKGSATDALSARVTLDVGREEEAEIEVPDGTGGTTTVTVPEDRRLRAFLKYAYLEWRTPADGVRARFGAAANAQTHEYDHFWGHRWLRKSPWDLAHLVHSSDLGVHLLGRHADGLASWQVSVVNGEGYTHPEGSGAPTAQARVTVDPLAGRDGVGLPVSAYGSVDLPGPADPDGLAFGSASVGLEVDSLLVRVDAARWNDAGVDGMGWSVLVLPRAEGLGELVLRLDHVDGDLSDDSAGGSALLAGFARPFARRVAAALTYERSWTAEAPDAPAHGVFARMEAGF